MSQLLRDTLSGYTQSQLLRMSKLVEIRNKRVDFALDHHRNSKGQPMTFRDCPFLEELYQSLSADIVLQSATQTGKAIPMWSKILTPSGWVENRDILPGSKVIAYDGSVCNVVAVHPQGSRPIFNVKFEDGRNLLCDAQHEWRVYRSKGKNQRGVLFDKELTTLTTLDILQALDEGSRFKNPLCGECPLPEKDLPIDPYALGALLGDGTLTGVLRFTSEDDFIVSRMNQGLANLDIEAHRTLSEKKIDFHLRVRTPGNQSLSEFRSILDSLGLLGTVSCDKFIPKDYKQGSITQRWAIVQGLMDTDGHSGLHRSVSYATVSPRLACDMQEILWSLGARCKIKVKKDNWYTNKGGERKNGPTSYILSITLPYPKRAFALPRKVDRLSTTNRQWGKLEITSVEFSHVEDAQCITIDHESSLFVGEQYLAVKNSEWAIIDHLAMAASGVPCMYVLPKYDIKNRFVQMRINRVIQTVPAYKKLAGRGFFDNCTSKFFGKSTIVYAGSNVESDFRETPAGAYYIDEVDHCNQANLRLLDDRIARSNFKFRRWLANPKFAGAGINCKFLESDQRHWHVPCPACNCHKKLEWFGCVVDCECDSKGNTVNYKLMDDQWKPGCGRDIYALCPDCGNPLDRMSVEGTWVPENEESDITGYRLSRIYSAFENLDAHWRAFQPAIMDPSVMETFCTSHLGIVSSNSGSRVTPDMLKKAAQDFHFVNAGDQSFIPDRRHEGPCSMGVDVGSRFDVRISTRRNGKRQALFIGKVTTMEELKELVQDFNVKCCVMDAMPEIHMVEEFQDWAFNADLDCGIWSCRYRPTEGKESKIHYKTNEMRILCDRTMLLDRSLAQVIRGFNALPSNVDALISGDYAKEFCAPVRSLQTAPNGTQRFQWRCAHEKIADHQRHADVYDLMAFDLIEDSVVADAVIL